MKVVGSIDAYGMRYSAMFSVQAHRTEHIQRMAEMTKQLLQNYLDCTHHKPMHIVFFRDGVGDTAYPQVPLSLHNSLLRFDCYSHRSILIY